MGALLCGPSFKLNRSCNRPALLSDCVFRAWRDDFLYICLRCFFATASKRGRCFLRVLANGGGVLGGFCASERVAHAGWDTMLCNVTRLQKQRSCLQPLLASSLVSEK